MEKKTKKKSGRGGAREGAGRKDKGSQQISNYFTAETIKAMGGKEKLKKKISQFVEGEVLKKKLASQSRKLERQKIQQTDTTV